MENNKLVEVIQNSGLEQEQSKTILDGFKGYFEQVKEWEIKAKGIIVTDKTQTNKMAEAREGRLFLKSVRCEANNKRKELKEKSTREGKAIQGMYNIIDALVVPLEEHLEKQEKFIEIEEVKKAEAKMTKRVERLSQIVDDVTLFPIRDLSDEGFERLLGFEIEAKEKKEKAIKNMEDARIEKEKADEEERKQLAIENAKLKKEAEEKAIKDKKIKAEQDKKDKKIKAEQDKKDKEEADKQAKLQAEIDEKNAKEEKMIAEAKAQKDKEEAEAKAKELSPDKDKLIAFSNELEQVKIPIVNSDEAIAKLNEAIKLLNQAQLTLKTL